MSPAMVDFRSPASASSNKFQSNRHRSKSSVADRILPFPSHPIFRSGGIPDPSPPMDRCNLGQGVSVSSSASIPPPPSNDSTSSEKLSVPRFRKQRKYSGTSRARPTAIPSDSGGDQGFNPFGFGSRTSHNASCVGVEEIGTQSVREQLFGWKPFVPVAPSHPSSGTSFVFGAGLSGPVTSSSNIVSESIKGTAFDLGSHNNDNSGPGNFVFGSGIEKGSILSRSSSKSSSAQSLGNADSAKSEGSRTILGTGTSTSRNVESVGTGIPVDGSVFSFGAGNASFDAGGFVYGNGAKKGGKSWHDSYLDADNNYFYKLNTKKPVNKKNEKLEPGFFVHKSGEKKITHSSKSSSFNSDDGFLAEQTERARKMDLNSTSDLGCQKEEMGVFLSGSCTGTKANLDQISSIHSGDSSILSFSKLPEELRKLKIEASTTGHNVTNDPAVFAFGSGVTKSTCSSKSSSFGASDSFSKLPEKMEKLNLHSSTTSTVTPSCSKNAQLSQTSSGPDEYGFSNIPRKLKNQNLQSSGNEEYEHVKHNAFVFGSNVKEKANTDKSSSLNFNEKKDAGVFMFGNGINKNTCASKNSSFDAFEFSSNLPEKMEKLDLCSSTYPVHVDTSSVNFISENSSKNAQFSQTSTGSEDGFFKIPGELKNQNLQSSRNEEHGYDKHGVFVFGSNVLEKANSDKSSSLSFDNTKDSGAFVFGSGINNSACASKSSSLDAFECSFSKLPNKMETLNLHSSACGVHVDTTGAVFGSECSSKNTQFSQTSSGLDEGGFSKFPGKFKVQNMQSLSSEEHGNHGVFVFGSDSRERTNSGKSSSFSFDESSTCKLSEEVRMMKLSSSDNEVGSQKSKLGSICNQHDNHSAFVSSNFILQFGKEDYCSRGARLQAHNSCGSNTETTTTLPTAPGFQTSESDFYFTSIHTTSETPRMEFRCQKQDTSMLTKENLFTDPHKNMTFGMKKEDYKSSRLKKKRGKSRQSTTMHSGTTNQCVHEDKGLVENLEQDSTGGYSPMDYSPYQETLVSNQYSREASIASDETINFDSRCTSNEAQRSGSVDGKEGELCSGSVYGQNEEIFSAAEHFSANEDHLENEALDCGLGLNFTSQRSRVNRIIPGPRKENVASKDDTFQPGITKNSSMESESFSYDSSKKQTAYDCSGFTFTSNLDDAAQSNFHFASPSFVQGQSSASRRIYQRKSRVKGGQDPHPNTRVSLASSPSNSFVFPSAHVLTDSKQETKCNDNGERAGNINGAKTTQEPASIAAASVKTEEACEKWRLRGNQAYAEGDLSKAEDYYSRGVDSFPLKEVSKICGRGLMLCYSNRAATRMSLGRFREALNDCKAAIAIDPSFLRARLRAGNIFLSLGEPADALQHFEKVLLLDKDAESDQKIQLEAVVGLEKAQKLNDIIDQSSTFLTKRTPDDAAKALELILEALSFSPYSEILLEMKAEALIKLRNFDEAIQICEQTLELAEKNAVVSDSGFQLKDDDERSYVRLWRWRIISKSYFYLGKLEEANELLKKHEKMKPVIDKYWSKYPESSASFPVIVCELLRLKAAGNEAFQAGKHFEAVELYTAALALNTESRPFTAICFCNRAAAYQALGQITDAIADCSLAIALDSSYRKAISRRATLHEIIRDYEQAATDLRKLTSLLEMSSEDKNSSCGTLGRSSSNTSDLNQVRIRLCTVEEDARKGGTMDLYMILGIEKSCSAAEVRKAYRKAALRHHPDKAGQFLARSENSDDRVWKEVAEEVYTNADRLFKIIGEAYTILVDPSKRQQYDIELESRSVKKSCGTYGGGSSPRTPASSHGSQFERSAEPRHYRGNTHRRWTESSWSNR